MNSSNYNRQITQKKPKLRVFLGITLIEVLAVLVVTMIGFSIAAPQLQTLLMTTSINGSVNHLHSMLRTAREEAKVRQGRVAVCAGLPTDTCSITDWSQGWTLFHTRFQNGVMILEPLQVFTPSRSDLVVVASDVFTDGMIVFDGLGILRTNTAINWGDLYFCSANSNFWVQLDITLTTQIVNSKNGLTPPVERLCV